MLRWRLLSAAVILSVLFGLLYLDYRSENYTAAWLMPVGVVMVVMATNELLGLLRAQKLESIPWVAYCGAALVVLATAAPMMWPWFGGTYPENCPVGRAGWPLLALALTILLAFSHEMWRYQEPGGITQRLAVTFFAVLYPSMLFAFIVMLRGFHDHYWGFAALVSVMLITKISDTGAYFTGRALGKHKMSPRLSPKKTIEGAVGGLLAAGLAAVAYGIWLVPRFVPDHEAAIEDWWRWLVFGIVIALAGMIGDLAASLIKRDTQQKDSSHWLPGLGGVLDIVDSVLAGAPAAYVLLVIGLVGPGG